MSKKQNGDQKSKKQKRKRKGPGGVWGGVGGVNITQNGKKQLIRRRQREDLLRPSFRGIWAVTQ